MKSKTVRYHPRAYQAFQRNFLAKVPVSVLMCIASALLLIDTVMDASVTNFLMFVLSLTGAIAVRWPRNVSRFFSGFWRWQRRYKINFVSLICVAMVTLWWLDVTTAPAHAQFFVQTENWLRGAFPINGATGGAGGVDIYGIVFNTLRAIFVLYLAVALVRVIAAARNDEDWQSLARTPLIILVTVTLGDILASLITGGAPGGPGGAPGGP